MLLQNKTSMMCHVTIIAEQFRYMKAVQASVIRDEPCRLLNKHGLKHSAVPS